MTKLKHNPISNIATRAGGLRRACFLIAIGLLAMCSGQAISQDALAPPAYGDPYGDIKPWHEHRMSLPRTNAEKLDDLHTLLKARIGQPGLDNMFGDRLANGTVVPGSGRLTLPLDTPGLEQSVRLSALDSWRSSEGYGTTLRYAERLRRGGRFRIDGLNQPYRHEVDGTVFRGDHDLQITSRRTGQKFDIEVKNRKPASLTKDFTRLQKQVSREIKNARAAGRQYVFVNRQGVPTRLREFIESQGGHCLENVSSKDIHAQVARLDRLTGWQRVRLGGGLGLAGVGLAGGVYEMYASGTLAYNEIHVLIFESDADATLASLNLARHSLRFVAGGVGATESVAGGLLMLGIGSGSKILTTYIPGVGLVVVPLVMAGEGGIAVVSWQLGHMSDADFGRAMTRLGVQAGGLAIGATIGGAIGSFFPVIGTLGGAVIGGAIGHGAASLGIVIYDWCRPEPPRAGLLGSMTSKEQQAHIRFLLERYGGRPAE
jgi:hypothetical protein